MRVNKERLKAAMEAADRAEAGVSAGSTGGTARRVPVVDAMPTPPPVVAPREKTVRVDSSVVCWTSALSPAVPGRK